MEGTGKPEYDKCVEISTKASLKEMMLPGILTIGFPLVITFLPMLFGMDKLMIAEMLGGYMAGVTVSGVLWAIFQNNAGGAWDNAKKSFEAGVMINGEMTHKGSAAHEAAITGDTVGDPFKDTSGPSMNILIKLTCLIGLVIAPILGETGNISHEKMSINQPAEVVNTIISSYTSSFTFDRDTKTINKIIFERLDCDNGYIVCRELMKLAEEYATVFNALGSSVEFRVADSEFNREVSGILVIGEKEYKADLFFTVRKRGEGVSFIGNIVISESSFLTEGEVVTIHIKGRQ